MKRIYEYKCRECGEIFDALKEEKHRTVGAQHSCGGWGDYIISRPYFKESIESDRWVKNRESHMKKEQKNMERHGTYN
jgi:hypothetical protein